MLGGSGHGVMRRMWVVEEPNWGPALVVPLRGTSGAFPPPFLLPTKSISLATSSMLGSLLKARELLQLSHRWSKSLSPQALRPRLLAPSPSPPPTTAPGPSRLAGRTWPLVVGVVLDGEGGDMICFCFREEFSWASEESAIEERSWLMASGVKLASAWSGFC